MGSRGRHYPEAEYSRVEGAPLAPRRLAQIWAALPERERLGFLHSLDETLADTVLAACVALAERRGGGLQCHTND